MNKIEVLPFSYTDYISFQFFVLILIYIIIFCLVVYLYIRRIRWLFFALISTLIFQIFASNELGERSQIVFYSVNKHIAILFANNEQSYLLCDSLLLAKKNTISYHTDGYLSRLSTKGVEKIDIAKKISLPFLWKDDCHLQYLEFRGLFVGADFMQKSSQEPIDLDFCLISKEIDIKKMLLGYRPKHIILDSRLPYYVVQRMKNQCQLLGIPCYNLKESSFSLKSKF